MPTTLEWSLVIISGIFSWIVCGVVIYFAFRFYKFRHKQAVQKRNPFLVHLLTICFVIYIGFHHTFHKLSFIYGTIDFDINNNYDTTNVAGNTFYIFAMIFYCSSIHGPIIIMIARIWIIYFNIKWSEQTQTIKWMIHITTNDDLPSFWFIKHRKDFGSHKLIYIFVIIYYIVEGILIFLFMISSQHIARTIDSLIFVIEISILIILWRKTPKLYDTFGIKQEMKYTLRLALIGIIIYMIWILKMMLFGYHLLTFVTFQFLFDIITGGMALILNIYVFKNERKLLSLKENKKKNSLKLKDTLNNKDLIEAFFKHLSDEWSAELLLAFIEMTQFKSLMMNDDNLCIPHDDDNNDDIVLCDKLPQSHIVFESYKNISNNMQKYLLITHDLFKKYIDYGAEFEININYECHQIITSFINHYCSSLNPTETVNLNETEQSELYTLFDNARNTLYILMRSSHFRFIQSIHYKSIAHWVQIIQTDKINDVKLKSQRSGAYTLSVDDTHIIYNDDEEILNDQETESKTPLQLAMYSKSHPVPKKMSEQSKLHQLSKLNPHSHSCTNVYEML